MFTLAIILQRLPQVEINIHGKHGQYLPRISYEAISKVLFISVVLVFH